MEHFKNYYSTKPEILKRLSNEKSAFIVTRQNNITNDLFFGKSLLIHVKFDDIVFCFLYKCPYGVKTISLQISENENNRNGLIVNEKYILPNKYGAMMQWIISEDLASPKFYIAILG